MKINRLIIFPSILLAIILVTYYQLFFTFYQQDEWGTLGHAMTQGLKGFLSGNSMASIIAGAGRPLAIPIQFIFYKFFPFQIAPFVLFAISLHFINSILLFIMVRKISKNTFISVLSSLFFTTASVGQQAVSWAAASTTTLPSTLFVLLAIYSYLFFLKKEDKKFIYLSFLFGIISYLFKESAIIIFLFLPFMFILYNKEKLSLLPIFKKHLIFLLAILYLVFIRIIDLLTIAKQTNFFLTYNSPTFLSVLFHAFLYPLESVSQIFIPDRVMFPLANYFVSTLYTRLSYSPVLEIASETIGAEMISFIISIIFLCIVGIIYILDKQKRKIISFGLIFIFISFIPLVMLTKGNAYLESRYFYLGVVGGAIIFGIFFDCIRSILSEKLKLNLKYATIIVGVIVSSYFVYQVSIISQDLKTQVDYARERKSLLASITKMYGMLPDKAIVYISGNSDFYVVNNKIPFQQGTGFTLMVWYYNTGKIPKEFIDENFLWELTSQGYKEIGNKGFGYFWNLNDLKKEIIEKKLNTDKVVAFYYDSNSKEIRDITPTIKKQISTSAISD